MILEQTPEQFLPAAAGPLAPAAVYATPGDVDDVLARVTQQAQQAAAGATADTPAGRATLKSVAYAVARTKTALDDMGKALVADWKTKAAAVDTERRRIRETLDRLKDEIRQPVTQWEIEEEGRQVRIAAKLQQIRRLQTPATAAAAVILAQLTEARAYVLEGFDEHSADARALLQSVTAQLVEAYDVATARELAEAEAAQAAAAAAAERKRLADELARAEAERQRIADEAAEAARQADAERQRIADEAAALQARLDAAEAQIKASQDAQALAIADALRAAQEAARIAPDLTPAPEPIAAPAAPQAAETGDEDEADGFLDGPALMHVERYAQHSLRIGWLQRDVLAMVAEIRHWRRWAANARH